MSLQKVTAKQVAQKVINQEKLFILDVRNEDDFKNWKIEGKNVSILNKPYFELLDGIDEIVQQLPKEQPILVVCAKEGSSEFVGNMIVDAGFNEVMYLEGGMKTWSDHLEPVKIGDLTNGGSVYQFVRIGKGCLSYMITSGKEALIIDAVRTVDPFIEFANRNDYTIKHVIDTHLHADHISGARKIRELTGAQYWLPPQDAEEVVFDYNELTPNSFIQLNDTVIDIVYSPGHTIGSTSIIVDNNYLFTGDILFVKSIGRPDLAGRAGEWAPYLRETLYELYKQMNKNLIVLPAHFSSVDELSENGAVSEHLGKLFEENEGLQIQDENTFLNTVSKNLPPQPNRYQDIRETNMGKINPNKDEQQEMEIGPNRCAVH